MKRTLQLLFILIFILPANFYSQSPLVQEIIDSVNQDSLVYFVRELSGDIPTIINGTPQTILSRHSYQPGNGFAETYIKQKFEYYGLNTTIQSFGGAGENVIAVQPGTEFPNVNYIICAHYDDMPPGTIAPGADDNASGTAAVIEAARILSQHSFPITIVYAAWDQEEQGLLGSFYYAEQAALAGDSILGVLNMDMISYDSNNDFIAEIHIYPISYTMFLSDKIEEINSLYDIGLNLHIVNPGSGGSDHVSFWLHNYSAVFLFEHSGNMNVNYHTVFDLVQNINPAYFFKYAKLGLGTLADVSLASLYGAIFAIEPYIDKTYARKNIDSVLFLTKFKNVFNHPFTSHLIYTNDDNTAVDSLDMFDDGLHGDSLSDDGIYGAYILPQQTEDFYSLDVSTIDGQTNKYFLTPDLSTFTTAGPITLDSIRFVKDMFNWYNLKPYVTNRGEETTITNAKIKLLCGDPWVTGLGEIPMSLPPIAPGETAAGSSWIAIEYNDTTFPGYFNIEAEISRYDRVLWKPDLIQLVVGMEAEHYQLISFSLRQNYPNPFNPSTNINYSLGSFCLVTIKVYDVLGREIAVLVNEGKPAGSYSVEFSGSGLASGIYFYQLRAGDFVKTNKMVLLR